MHDLPREPTQPPPPQHNHHSAHGKRVDIQVLRALAVTLVFLFHLDVDAFKGGFIGVDVFFVVSGYLVFGSLIRDMLQPIPRFSLAEFTSRRMKRLCLPSGVCLTALCVFLYFSLRCHTSAVWGDIMAASLHYVNIHFWLGSLAYFTVNSDASLVLHFWSLAVEEQLYLAIPLILMAFRWSVGAERFTKYLAPFLIVLTCISLSMIFWQSEAVKFFCPPSRLWEFSVGALVAYYEQSSVRPPPDKIISEPLCFLSMLSLLLFGMFTPRISYPNLYTVPVVAMTAFILFCRLECRCSIGETIGNWSYSIYLYHWPIIQLIKYFASLGASLGPVWSVALPMTLICSALSYYIIELPIQRISLKKRHIALLSLMCTVVPLLLSSGCNHQSVGEPDYSSFDVNFNLDQRFHGDPNFDWYTNNSATSSQLLKNIDKVSWTVKWNSPWTYHVKRSKDVVMMLVGDSHALHYFNPVKKYAEMIGASFVLGTRYSDYYDYSIFLAGLEKSVAYDVMAYPHRVVFLAARCTNETTRETFEAHLEFWSQVGCLVLVADNPNWGHADSKEIHPVQCLNERPPTECVRPAQDVVSNRDTGYFEDYLHLHPLLRNNAAIININDLVCWNGICRANINDMPLYMDRNHFSQLFMNFAAPIFIQRAHQTICMKRAEALLNFAMKPKQ